MQLSFILFASLSVLCKNALASPITSDAVPGLTSRGSFNRISSSNIAGRKPLDSVGQSTYPFILNLTCIISPEVDPEGYTRNAPVRQNVTEGQTGIALTLDIGVLDITTCKPLPQVMVEIWSTNAQGNYGATFLRGASPTGSNGIAEFQTIFPGFTSEGANHINVMVYSTSSTSSEILHSGQLFFTDKWTTIIGMQPPYNTNTHQRITNLDDPVFMAANSAGFYPVVDIESIHDDWPEGIIGYITLGVDPSKAHGRIA